MRTSTTLLLLTLALACGRDPRPAPLAPDPATRRELPAGAVVGGVGGYGAHVWRAIPYATPPTGDRRWRAPERAPRWEGTRGAVAVGRPCPQVASPFGVRGPSGAVVGDEDCLTLDVYAPAFAPDAVPAGGTRLPVMVWIHGGGNVLGESAFFDGGNLATQERVIVVAIQYRLGPLGWFRHAALRDDAADARERSGNFGLLDQIRALEWVRDNVAAFGGDPGRVTIFGESAGGQDVFMLLVSPPARGLFHRAIAQSGGLWTTNPHEAEAPAAEGGHAQSSAEIVRRLLERHERDAAAPADLAAFLRELPAAELIAAYPHEPNGLCDLPRMFSDGVVVPAGEALDALRASAARVPVVAGTTRDENKLFLFGDERRVRRLLWIFPRFVDETQYEVVAEYLARMWKATGADEPASAVRAAGGRAWVYRFDWDEQPTVLGADLSRMIGAAHAFEIPFVFGHFDLGPEGEVMWTRDNEPGRRALAAAMMSWWAAFAYDGDPGRGRRGELPAWLPWEDGGPGGPRTMVLDTPAGGGVRLEPAHETRAGVLAALAADPRLAEPARRCDALAELARFGRGFSRAEYARTCAAFPLES